MEEVIYVNQPLSSRVIMELLDKHPHLKKIQCPPSLYRRTSTKYLDALNELGIEVESVEKKGRPRKYKKNDVIKVQGMLKKGFSPKNISEKLGIPTKSVYYLKDTHLKPGRKSKYNTKTRQKVKKMFKDGYNAKEISKKLKIPPRTVYYILRG
ncbi:MAG: helix-turn-helix domain-containing protein [Methanobacteriaceae archaeon]|nr:helix-turn-helix domain-containing protein [Methanobacteriaceae archaeon]